MSKKLIEQLHPVGFATQVKRIEELKRANQHLIMALADAEALEIGTAEQCDALQADRDEWKASAEFSYRQRDELNRLCEFNEKTMSALQADNARLRDKFEHVLEYWNGDENYRAMSDALNHIEDVVSEALAATPEQSLARIRNQVREECALEADRQSEDEPYGHAKFRCANIALEIRAMKEPE